MGVVDARVAFITTEIVPFVDEFARRLFAELDYVQVKGCLQGSGRR